MKGLLINAESITLGSAAYQKKRAEIFKTQLELDQTIGEINDIIDQHDVSMLEMAMLGHRMQRKESLDLLCIRLSGTSDSVNREQVDVRLQQLVRDEPPIIHPCIKNLVAGLNATPEKNVLIMVEEPVASITDCHLVRQEMRVINGELGIVNYERAEEFLDAYHNKSTADGSGAALTGNESTSDSNRMGKCSLSDYSEFFNAFYARLFKEIAAQKGIGNSLLLNKLNTKYGWRSSFFTNTDILYVSAFPRMVALAAAQKFQVKLIDHVADGGDVLKPVLDLVKKNGRNVLYVQ